MSIYIYYLKVTNNYKYKIAVLSCHCISNYQLSSTLVTS